MGFGRDQNYSVTGKALMRLTREMTLEEQGANCKKMEKGLNWMDGAMGIAGLALGVAALFTMPLLITVSTALLVNVMIAKTLVADENIERECADLPFKELDEKMKARQEETDKKIAEETEILKGVSAKVSQTLDRIDDLRSDMDFNFHRVLKKVGDLDSSNPASDIKTAIESIAFNAENRRLATRDRYVYIIQQEVSKKSDSSLYNYIGMQGSLYKGIFAVINKKNTIQPKIALTALNAGLTNYATTVFTLVDELRYLSEHFYQKGDLKKFNNFFNSLVFDFNFFKLILNGSLRKQGMIDQVKQVLSEYKSKSKQELGDELFENIGTYITELEQLKEKVAALNLDIIESTPDNSMDIDFNSRTGDQRGSTPFLDWKEGSKVSYAVQFEKDGKYSKVSGWTSQQQIMKIANPDVELRKPSNMNRLVFRKLGNGDAELAFVLSGSEVKFRDVHRDLYNLPSKSSLSDADVVSSMEKLISLGGNPKAVFEGKKTVIHAAAAAGRTGMLSKLIEKDGSLLNQPDRNGYTPLHIAAENKRTAFAKELINLGADVNAQGIEYKVTPLHLAVRYHAEEIVDALLNSGNIDPNLKDVAGLSPLIYAITDEDYSKNLFTKLVKNRKTDLKIKDNNGLAPVHYVTILNRWEELIDMDVEGDRFNIYAKDNKQMLALHYDAMKGNKLETLIGTLLSDHKAAKLNEVAGDKNWTPLHYAVYFKQTDWVRYLFKNWHKRIVSKINVDVKDADNQTPLHLAAAAGLKDIAKILLEHGAKVFEQTKKGNTALDIAIIHGNKDVVEELLNFESKQKFKGKPAKEADTKACGLAKGEVLDLLKQKNRCSNFRRAIDANSAKKFEPSGTFEGNSFSPLLASRQSKENLKLKDSFASTNVDVNGALLLLDVFIRKMTDAKHGSEWVQAESSLDARAQALNITDNLQRIMELSAAGNGQGDADLFDIHSKIYKAIMSGNDYKLVKEVCTYLDEYSTLEPQKIENFVSAMLPDKFATSSKRSNQRNLENLLAQACYQNNN